MITNYHTHTYRCHHAKGTDREYVEMAVNKGLKVLGFSDHSPYCFDNGYYSSFRMKLDEIEGYVSSLKSLREEFKDKIDVYIGYEMEYYPKYFDNTIKLIDSYGYDYIILGQHYINNEIGQQHATKGSEDFDKFKGYVDTVIEAIKTKMYFFIAHPDVINYTGDSKIYKKEMERLCVTAKEYNTPLEFNLLGFRTHRNYPNLEFWKIASDVGCDVILGCDAHEPEAIALESDIIESNKIAKELSLNVIEPIKPIKHR